MNTLTIDLAVQDGDYVLTAITDKGDETIQLASAQTHSLDTITHIIKQLIERNLPR